MAAGAQIGVWAAWLRIIHWSVAGLVCVELLNEASANPWHRNLGYAAVGLVIVRLALGLLPCGHARLVAMAACARRSLSYARQLRRPLLFVGHTPLGALMAFVLWALILLVGLTGWMQTLDAFWGEEWMQHAHEALAYALLACAAIHVAAAFAIGRLQGTSLVKSMITGRKSVPG